MQQAMIRMAEDNNHAHAWSDGNVVCVVTGIDLTGPVQEYDT